MEICLFIVFFVVRRLHPLPVGTLWMKFESNFTKDRKYALAKESGLGNGDFSVFSEQYALYTEWCEKYAFFTLFNSANRNKFVKNNEFLSSTNKM